MHTIELVRVYPASTAIPTFSVSSSNPPVPSSPMRSANPFSPPPISPQSPAASVHRFISLRLTFSIDPLKCAENLLVKTSLSRNRWSGCWSAADELGRGRLAKRASKSGSVGSLAGARSGFLGTSVTGGEWSTSTQGVSGSRNRRKTRSVPRVRCSSVRLRNVESMRRRRAIRAASSLALEGCAPTMAYDASVFLGGRGGTMKQGCSVARACRSETKSEYRRRTSRFCGERGQGSSLQSAPQ